jgi:hypothetical protein
VKIYTTLQKKGYLNPFFIKINYQMNNFKEELERSKTNHLWNLQSGYYTNIPNLIEVFDLFEQTFFGDFYYIINNEKIYIEEKWNQQKGDYIFIETWSDRRKNYLGWIYIQVSDVILYRYNIHNVIKLDTLKLKKWWFNLYPNPLYLDKNKEQILIKKLNNTFSHNITEQYNHSEGFYIPVNILLLNNIGKIL